MLRQVPAGRIPCGRSSEAAISPTSETTSLRTPPLPSRLPALRRSLTEAPPFSLSLSLSIYLPTMTRCQIMSRCHLYIIEGPIA